jgi:hypothetical protein
MTDDEHVSGVASFATTPAGFRELHGRDCSDLRTRALNEGLARWTYEGRTGYGISEYLHQLDANAPPVVPVE